MNEKQIKRKLEEMELKVSDVVRAVSSAFPNRSPIYLNTAIRNLIAGRQWLPVYAAFIEKEFGIKIDRPIWLENSRKRMRKLVA
jgi:hypothetical protein